nr:uncharacterized protein LOC105712198 isoform X2 [Aotus nancymaae]
MRRLQTLLLHWLLPCSCLHFPPPCLLHGVQPCCLLLTAKILERDVSFFLVINHSFIQQVSFTLTCAGHGSDAAVNKTTNPALMQLIIKSPLQPAQLALWTP